MTDHASRAAELLPREWFMVVKFNDGTFGVVRTCETMLPECVLMCDPVGSEAEAEIIRHRLAGNHVN